MFWQLHASALTQASIHIVQLRFLSWKLRFWHHLILYHINKQDIQVPNCCGRGWGHALTHSVHRCHGARGGNLSPKRYQQFFFEKCVRYMGEGGQFPLRPCPSHFKAFSVPCLCYSTACFVPLQNTVPRNFFALAIRLAQFRATLGTAWSGRTFAQ